MQTWQSATYQAGTVKAWAADIICCTVLDPETCVRSRHILICLVAASILALICFGNDRALKLWKYARNSSDNHLLHFVGDYW